MPVYDTLCVNCQMKSSVFRTIATRDCDLPVCCGQTVIRTISAPAIRPDISPYLSPQGNYMVNSRAEQREDLKRSGCILVEPGLKEQIARNRVYQQEKAFKPLAAAVDETVAQLVAAGKLET